MLISMGVLDAKELSMATDIGEKLIDCYQNVIREARDGR